MKILDSMQRSNEGYRQRLNIIYFMNKFKDMVSVARMWFKSSDDSFNNEVRQVLHPAIWAIFKPSMIVRHKRRTRIFPIWQICWGNNSGWSNLLRSRFIAWKLHAIAIAVHSDERTATFHTPSCTGFIYRTYTRVYVQYFEIFDCDLTAEQLDHSSWLLRA